MAETLRSGPNRSQNAADYAKLCTATKIAGDNCVTSLDLPDPKQEGNDSNANDGDSDHVHGDDGGGDSGGDPQEAGQCHFCFMNSRITTVYQSWLGNGQAQRPGGTI